MEKLKYSGHISIESDSGNIKELDHNTITHLFEELVATIGIDTIISKASPINAGKTYYQGAAFRDYQYRYYTDRSGNQLITVYLLNLSAAEKAALSSDSYVLPAYSSDFLSIDSNKLIGYATARINPSAASKEGHIIPHSGVLLVNNREHGLTWRFEPNTVSGTFNTVAIGLNVIDDNWCSGVRLARSLDFKSVFGGAYQNALESFMIPNVKSQDGTVVWTADYEILLGDLSNSSYADVARNVLNLVTGELTTLESSDPRYGLTLYTAYNKSQFVFGDWLINGATLPAYNNYSEVYAINIKTKTTKTLRNAAWSARGFFTYNGYLYVCGGGSAPNFTAIAYDSNLDAVPAADLTMTLLNSWGLDTCTILPYGANYLYIHYNSSTTGVKRPELAHCFIFTDPTDIANSIIGVLPGVQPSCVTFIDDEPFMFDSGKNQITDYFEEAMTHTYRNGNDESTIQQNGLKFTRLGMFGNLFSFKVYNEDKSISAGDGVKVEYWYHFDE